ncbi:fumarylacetoacetate hydrolase family protein [Thalassotalea sp. 1_MG-2023]|uniref:fumarylacetoacetate hydrolase family protein n=1 Tax=Thalassotalea sp. 1_MG-2023 TaxID=3062680 RepID=UPI0026E32CBD|nr:fumarylacetoacetate hydrolase family protein [Thalassotalea sp. 1_MG-2023]MDO6426629.1 fumarylacetoacetate hydrolase family protein [Thalassotalea sp. 1_MG-2023]
MLNSVNIGTREVTPSNIICIGRNYVEHIEELGNEIPEEMVVFNKPNSAISKELYSFYDEPLHYEAELCFIVEKGLFSAVGFGIDLTKRALQAKLKTSGLPWERAKAFNGAAVFSDFKTITPDDINNTLRLVLTINDEVAQQGGVQLMMHKPNEILTELSSFTTVNDGDIIMSGTPKGVGKISKGDLFEGNVYLGEHLLVSKSWVAQ